MREPDICKISGEKFAILPLADYKELISQIEDLQHIKSAKAVEYNIGEYFPSAIAERILDGHNSIRVLREYRNLTQEQLANMARISRAYLSEIETERKEPSLKTLKSIAEALNVDLDDIV